MLDTAEDKAGHQYDLQIGTLSGNERISDEISQCSSDLLQNCPYHDEDVQDLVLNRFQDICVQSFRKILL